MIKKTDKLVEATMLALQGKLELKENRTSRRSRKTRKSEGIDVNVDDNTSVSVEGNETIVDTADATVIVSKKEDEFIPETSDDVPMEAPVEEPVVDAPVAPDEDIVEVPADDTVMPEEIVDEPVDTELPVEESKKIENKKLQEWIDDEYDLKQFLAYEIRNKRPALEDKIDVSNFEDNEIVNKVYDEISGIIDYQLDQALYKIVDGLDESKKVESVEIEVSDDGKEVEVTTDNGEEVEVKNETPEENEDDEVEDTETEIPVDDEPSIDEMIEENKKVESKKLPEQITDEEINCAETIANKVYELGIMNWTEVDEMICNILKLDIDDIKAQDIANDVYGCMTFYNGLRLNYSTGDFYTDEYAEEHPEILEESKNLKNKYKKVEAKEYRANMSVKDLTPEQRLELKQNYLTQKYDRKGKSPSYGELADADNLITDKELDKEYANTVFCDDDFMCSMQESKKVEDTEEYLEPKFDPRASFYKKAKVVKKDNGDEELYSYGTHVGGVRSGKPYSKGKFSNTTSRHQREFFRQKGVDPKKVDVEEGKQADRNEEEIKAKKCANCIKHENKNRSKKVQEMIARRQKKSEALNSLNKTVKRHRAVLEHKKMQEAKNDLGIKEEIPKKEEPVPNTAEASLKVESKFSSKSFNEALTKYYKDKIIAVESVEVTKLSKTRTGLKIEANLKNKNGKLKRAICLEMKQIQTGKSFDKYELIETKGLVKENKANSNKVTMTTFTNKNHIIECRYILSK